MSLNSTPKRCRTCLEKTQSHVSVHEKVPIDEDNVWILEILKYCGQIEVLHNDRKPENMCTACIEKAKEAYRFKLMCMQSETTLNMEILNKMINRHNSLEFIKEDDTIEVNDEEIRNIKDEQPNLNNVEVDREMEAESDDSFNDYDNAEREVSSDCFENNDEQEESSNTIENNNDDVENAGKTKECKHKCPHCDKSYKYRYNMLRHLHSHESKNSAKTKKRHFRTHGKGEEKCLYCNFKGKGIEIDTHMHKNHGDRKTIQCPDCNRRFFQQANLTQHMVSHTDTGVKEYICNECDKPFSEKHNLMVHTRLHTGEKPYKCGVCGSAFPDPSGLRYHNLKHHSKGPKFTCDLCGKKFLQKCALSKHILTHAKESLSCSKCGKKFRKRHIRDQHMSMMCGKIVRPHPLRSHKASLASNT